MLQPILHFMPRVKDDINKCVASIARQPWGKPDDRLLDIRGGIHAICSSPEASRPELKISDTGIQLRPYRARDRVLVDFCYGLSLVNPINGTRLKTRLFAGARGASSYSGEEFCEASKRAGC